MAGWTNEQLDRIEAADELEIAAPRRDGTLRSPVPIWVVRHGDALYVRSYRGEDAVWYRSAHSHRRARISVHGITTDVELVGVGDEDVNAEVDAAYRSKYGRYGPRFIEPMVAAAARATTSKLIPRSG